LWKSVLPFFGRLNEVSIAILSFCFPKCPIREGFSFCR
jgi:hypothetical protein